MLQVMGHFSEQRFQTETSAVYHGHKYWENVLYIFCQFVFSKKRHFT